MSRSDQNLQLSLDNGVVYVDVSIADHFHANMYVGLVLTGASRSILEVRKKLQTVSSFLDDKKTLFSLRIGLCSAPTMSSYRCSIHIKTIGTLSLCLSRSSGIYAVSLFLWFFGHALIGYMTHLYIFNTVYKDL